MVHSSRVLFVRDALGATAILAALYALAFGVQFSPIQIPGYLVVVGFDLLEVVFGPAGAGYPVLFAAYLLGLGLVSAAVSYALRRRGSALPSSSLRPLVAGALALVGALSLLVAVGVLLGSAQREPVLITATTGAVLLVLAGWLAGLFDVELTRPARE